QTNVPLYNTFVVVEFVLVLLMARAQQPRWSKAMAVVAVLGIAGFAFNALFVDPRKEMLFEGTVWISFLLACVISALLWRMANTIGQDLRTVPAFWLFTAMGVYFIALPPVIGLARSLRADLHLASTIWTIMPVLCTIRYLLAAYAFWIEGNRSRT
ncbi:MAG TPA: hypothetical protein PKY96_15775, partial [Flavobacteriales bacterium]|nr:hypothetical protein [Flavobacteriales bacterium]